MDKNLPTSLSLMFGSEGGYSNRKTDSGGPTKYGITHRTLAAELGIKSVSAERVQSMSMAEAEKIYRKSYWAQSGGTLLPSGLDYAAFDYGVNSGPSRAVKSLQKVVGVSQDGIVGGETLRAVKNYPGGIEKLIKDYCDERMRFLRSLGGSTGWSANGRGWTIRVTGTDPKGVYRDAPGVIGNALRVARGDIIAAPEVSKEGTVQAAKANPNTVAITEVLKKPEAWAPLGGLISAVGALFNGDGPMQYALAAGVVAGISIGVWFFVRRVRSNN